MLSVNMYTAAARMCMHVVYIGSANASARLVSTVQFDHKREYWRGTCYYRGCGRV